MTQWKQNGKYPDSMFGLNFREEYPDIAKELSNGLNYDFSKSFTKDGYTYKAKQVTAKKDQKQYIFVERTPVSGDMIVGVRGGKSYEDGAKKGHEENIAMHKERISTERELITEVTNLRESINALLEHLRSQELEKGKK